MGFQPQGLTAPTAIEMDTRQLTIYTGIGPKLTSWQLDLSSGALTETASLELSANIQYAWPHPSGRLLYVASSDGGGRHGPAGDCHYLTTVSITSVDQPLSILASPIRVPSRPIHITVEPEGRLVLAAFNQPAALRAYRIEPDGAVGPAVSHAIGELAGNYPHQSRVTPDGKFVLSTALGDNPTPEELEDPGSVNVFALDCETLRPVQRVAPNGGFGFGPRHLEIHPNGRWVYVALERQNMLAMFTLADGRMSPEPMYIVPLLSKPQVRGVKQIAGALHMHPNGQSLYVVNRASDTRMDGSDEIFSGGENTLATFSLNSTGEPTLIQHIETRGIHCRTFCIEPQGRFLLAAHITGMNVKEAGRLRKVPPNIVIFQISADGRLHLRHVLPMDTGGHSLCWMGMIEPVLHS